MFATLALLVAAASAAPMLVEESPEPLYSKPHCHDENNNTAACCIHISNKHIIKFNDMVCLNTTLHLAPDRSLANSSIELDLSIDSKSLYDKTFDLAHLGKVCADIPDVPTAKVCAEFEDTNLTKHEFKTCIDLTLSALGHHIGHPKKVGCIHFHV